MQQRADDRARAGSMSRWQGVALAAAAAAGWVAGPLSAREPTLQPLVVHAAGPSAASYPVRSRVRGDVTLRLRAGDTLTLLDARGTRRLRGPGSFRLSRMAAPGGSELNRIAAVLRSLVEPPRMKRRIAGLRGFQIARKGAGNEQTLWFVDVGRAGRYCSPAEEMPELRRTEAREAASVTLWRDDGTGEPVVVPFPAGVAAQAWPGTRLVPDGRFAIALGGKAAQGFALSTVALPADTTPDAVALALLDHGCERQLDYLVERLAVGDAPPRR